MFIVKLFTDKGLKRKVNEDSLLLLTENSSCLINEKDYFYQEFQIGSGPFICAISDGMGGHGSGDVASRIVLEEIQLLQKNFFQGMEIANLLSKNFTSMNERIVKEGKKLNQNIGATIIGIYIPKEDEFISFHAGDSRLYQLSSNYLMQVTEDHNFETLSKKSNSKIVQKNLKYLYNCVGGGTTENFIEISQPKKVKMNQIFCLTSDGIHEYISFEDLESTLPTLQNEHSFQILREKIYTEKNAPDNLSIITIEKI